ncbi:hypothetical protein LTR65_009554 [Meristemomyces frigidus]
MDINALLSPDNPPAPDRASPKSSPRKTAGRPARPAGGKRTSSGLSQEVKRSPDRITSQPYSRPSSGYGLGSYPSPQQAFPLHPIAEAAPGFRPLQQQPQLQPTSNPSPAPETTRRYEAYAQQQQQAQQTSEAHRRSSTPQTENLRHSDNVEAAQRSSPTSSKRNQRPPINRNSSGQSMTDLTMAEAPAQTPPPRSFTSTALSDAESQTVTDLLNYLNDNSYAYDSHVQLIYLLHKGFLAHTHPPAEDTHTTPSDPHSYGLLAELRQAREAMDTRFAVGEVIWLEWLADEMILARSGEERITVTELYQKAVQDEPASVKLWQAYVDWVEANYKACNDMEGSTQTGWTEEDKEMCRELFTSDMLNTVLEQALPATQWRIDESHMLWDRYAELVMQALPASPVEADIQRIRDMFLQRLQVPHATSTETAQQMLWPIVNKYYPASWEDLMDQANEIAEPARKQVALRQEHESSLHRAAQAGDQAAMFSAFSTYLQWERKHRKRGIFGQELCCGLYERALLRFPTYTDWWLDYVDLVSSTTASSQASVLPLIERATRHSPWSGDLWARRILRSDVEGKAHFDIEATKHRATNSGLLDVGGMEELLKVLQQWCSYLRRHAFSATASEDDSDTAEVGITMAIEDIEQAGKTIYGAAFTGDPLYRLETIQIKFFTEARRFNDARDIYKRLVSLHMHEADFWAKYYLWELMLWGCERLSEKHRIESQANEPHLPTAVLQSALSQKVDSLDAPERVLDMYLNHFQQHEGGEKLQGALIDAREFSKRLAARRAKEAEATAGAAAQQQPPSAAAEAQPAVVAGEKRKAQDAVTNGDSSKKAKIENIAVPTTASGEPSSSATVQVKRDREHNTVTVRNLPAGVQELDVKKFFRDVGQPTSINILQDKTGDTATATVEFQSHEDVLAAKTRNGKELNGNEVHVHGGSQNTLYVANYPPEYDEAAVRTLFDSYGEILSVRFPSLKFNNRRRFCYVQFLTEGMARAAEEAMDSKMLDGQHKLVAKVSNPDAKKQRSGAQAEGREVFVKNIDREASEREVTEFFGQYGTVSSVNLVKLVNGKRTGTGFVVFAGMDEANNVLAANNKPFRDRILHVEISGTKAEGRTAPMDRARKTDVFIKHGDTVSASPEPDATGAGRRGSDVSMASASQPPADQEAFRTARERKIAIFSLPDTVNDARIRAAMEAYGPIVKIQLRRTDRGAIVEFSNINDAFNVRQGVDCSALGPEVKTGDVADLLNKVKKRQAQAPSVGAPGIGMRPTNIARPGQRGGRRGGLGFKRGGGFGGTRVVEGDGGEAEQAAPTGSGGSKSNADFRAIFSAGKADSKSAAETAEGTS